LDRYDYRGAIHLHSTYSDGNGDVAEIMEAASAAGLDYVILTDHDQLDPSKHEGWHGSTLLIVGAEITPPENHLIVAGEGVLENIGELKKKSPQEYIDAAGRQNWLSFIAHPNYVGSKRFGSGTYRWVDWNATGFTGIGVWHLIDDWLRQLDRDDVSPAEVYDHFPNSLRGPDPEVVRRWDTLCKERKVVAIGELDNHKMTRTYGEREYTVFPYEMAFRSIANHLLISSPLSKDAPAAKKQVLDALRHGSLYISMDWEFDPTDFSFYIDHLDENYYMGDRLKLEEEADANVVLPEEAEISLFRNGELLHRTTGFEMVEAVEDAGVYRVEVRRDGRIWILSNPIYVTE
jgi:hypothetical protein